MGCCGKRGENKKSNKYISKASRSGIPKSNRSLCPNCKQPMVRYNKYNNKLRKSQISYKCQHCGKEVKIR